MNLCQSCGMVENGEVYHELLTEYRGMNLCGWCIRQWKIAEKDANKTLDYQEYLEFRAKKYRNFSYSVNSEERVNGYTK